jgi:adenylate kinase
MNKYRTVLLFGAPGSGKGTQGKILGTIPNYYHFSCGEVFRNVRADSALGKIFLQYSGKGQLVPDEHTIKLWRQTINGAEGMGRFNTELDTMVLDGIPRNAHQAEMLDGTIDVKALFYLSCPDISKLVERIQRRALIENRLDDANMDVIRQRLDTYDETTKPVLDFYGKRYGPNLIHTIDSTQKPINVLRDILRVLATL